MRLTTRNHDKMGRIMESAACQPPAEAETTPRCSVVTGMIIATSFQQISTTSKYPWSFAAATTISVVSSKHVQNKDHQPHTTRHYQQALVNIHPGHHPRSFLPCHLLQIDETCPRTNHDPALATIHSATRTCLDFGLGPSAEWRYDERGRSPDTAKANLSLSFQNL